jgi:hypothetical protein
MAIVEFVDVFLVKLLLEVEDKLFNNMWNDSTLNNENDCVSEMCGLRLNSYLLKIGDAFCYNPPAASPIEIRRS